jgi:glycosyltransferase involved in cell wall biosynthesis
MKNTRKSICIVIPNYITTVIGGAELQCYYLAEELSRRGWAVEIVHYYTTDKIKYPQYVNPSIKISPVKEHKFRIISLFKGLRVLCTSDAYYYYQRTDSPLNGAVALLSRFRKIYSIYSCADNESFLRKRYTGKFGWSEYKSKRKAYIRYFDLVLIDKFLEMAKTKANLIIAQTKQQAKLFKENFNRTPVILRNSSVFKVFEPSEKEKFVVWVGNLRKIKRPELFLEIFRRCRLSGYTFVMIGEMAEVYDIPDTLEYQSNTFKYLGKLSFEETEKWINNARFIINTSDSEGFSNTFIQSWYYRTYILSLNSDPDELFSANNFGYFANGKLDMLVQKLEEYADNYPMISEKITDAESFVKKEFDLYNNISKFESLLFSKSSTTN